MDHWIIGLCYCFAWCGVSLATLVRARSSPAGSLSVYDVKDRSIALCAPNFFSASWCKWGPEYDKGATRRMSRIQANADQLDDLGHTGLIVADVLCGINVKCMKKFSAKHANPGALQKQTKATKKNDFSGDRLEEMKSRGWLAAKSKTDAEKHPRKRGRLQVLNRWQLTLVWTL